MYLPIPFYRALAEMQGSRFVLTGFKKFAFLSASGHVTV